MTKQQILDEIRRTTEANGGKPLGREAFAKETGIKMPDWYGRYWSRWGDALTEAGFTPNQFQRAFDDEFLIRRLIEFIRELHPPRFPVEGELRIKGRSCDDFPSHGAFTRLGNKSERVAKVAAFSAANEGYGDILALCRAIPSQPVVSPEPSEDDESFGFVYLLKCGSNFKIGHTNSTGRRERELAIQLPDKAVLIHEIRTDDPPGIETYWHHRFRSKRKNGEWFALVASDVKAFKRRKFM